MHYAIYMQFLANRVNILLQNERVNGPSKKSELFVFCFMDVSVQNNYSQFLLPWGSILHCFQTISPVHCWYSCGINYYYCCCWYDDCYCCHCLVWARVPLVHDVNQQQTLVLIYSFEPHCPIPNKPQTMPSIV